MENRFHFGFKIVVIAQNAEMMKKLVESVPGATVEANETFRFLKVFTFPLYVSDSLILRIDLWSLPDDVKQRGDAQLLCCDSSIVIYVAKTENDIVSILNTFHKDIRASNTQCRYVCFCENPENSSQLSSFGIQKIENLQPDNVGLVFKNTLASIISEIPNPPDPVFMLHKNVKLGSLLLDDPSYKKALRPVFPQ